MTVHFGTGCGEDDQGTGTHEQSVHDEHADVAELQAEVDGDGTHANKRDELEGAVVLLLPQHQQNLADKETGEDDQNHFSVHSLVARVLLSELRLSFTMHHGEGIRDERACGYEIDERVRRKSFFFGPTDIASCLRLISGLSWPNTGSMCCRLLCPFLMVSTTAVAAAAATVVIATSTSA